jgi:TonB family protein
MKNLPKLLPVFLLFIFVGSACENNSLVEKNPAPTNSETPVPNQTTPSPDVSEETLNEKAIRLPQPAYPAAAKTVKASGAVRVEVEIDEKGLVMWANAVSGHPLLRSAAEQSARLAKFKPSGKKIKGIIVYNFTAE